MDDFPLQHACTCRHDFWAGMPVRVSTHGARGTDSKMYKNRRKFGDLVRARLCEQQGQQCFYCLLPLHYMQAIIEHKTPLSRGGLDKRENLCAACRDCDQEKGSRTAEEYLEMRAGRVGLF